VWHTAGMTIVSLAILRYCLIRFVSILLARFADFLAANKKVRVGQDESQMNCPNLCLESPEGVHHEQYLILPSAS
jgi:hypothetical protein